MTCLSLADLARREGRDYEPASVLLERIRKEREASKQGGDLLVRSGGTLMIDIQQFESIKQKHGAYASWAVWADAGGKPNSNVGNMSVFDLDSNPTVLDVLNTSVIMVGLNISRPLPEPFRNFHDLDAKANDSKIRYAFERTAYYGAYMTDIIKGLKMVDSTDVLRYLKAHPSLIKENVAKFRVELQDLDSKEPTLLAFGTGAYRILNENMRREEYFRLIKLTHYSHQINKEKYREEVWSQINAAMV